VKWYKRDPDAALIGFRGLSHDEKSAYGTIIDLLYSRDGDVPDDERLLCVHIECRPQWWRRVRAALIAKGKIWATAEGKLMANRVETTLKEAANFGQTQAKRARQGWVSKKNPSGNNGPAVPTGNANTTTTTSTDIEARASISPESVATAPQPKKRVQRTKRAKTSQPDDWHPEIAPTDATEFGRFTDYCKANGRLYADWDAAWRNWKSSPYRNAGGHNGQGRRHGSVLDAADRLEAKLNAQGSFADLYVPGSSGPTPLRLDQEVRPPNLRVIPKR
jgi:hypothetical protein